jgi:hypothetical protein
MSDRLSVRVLAALLFAVAASPLYAQTIVTQIGDETTASTSTATTPVYRSSATST